jgi:4-coumarate--CoA ligase
MVFHAHGGLHIDHIPDDITLPDLVLDSRYGRRPLSESNKKVLIDAPTGKSVNLEQLKERTESLAKAFKSELGVKVGWDGVIGMFSPNQVSSLGDWT